MLIEPRVSDYNRGVCSVDIGAMSRVFADLRWRRGLCAKKPRGGIANGGGMTGGRRRRGSAAQEGGRFAWVGSGANSVIVWHRKVPV